MFLQFLYSLFPEEGFMPLFHAIVTGVWGRKHADHEQWAALVQRRMSSIEARKQKLTDAVVERLIGKEVYDDQMAIVGTELAAAQSQLSERLVCAEELESLLA